MSIVSEKTEVVVEEFDIDEPVEAPIEEKSNDVPSENLSRKSNRELVEEASRQVETQNEDGAKDETVEEPDEEDDTQKPPKEQDRSVEKKFQKKQVFEKEDLRPPQSFTSKEKEIYNKAPKELKTALRNMVSNMEAQFTRTQQELKAKTGEASELLEVIKPFTANLAEQGFSVPKGIAQLLGVQAKLTNPTTKDDTYIRIGLDVKPSEAAYKKLGQHLGYVKDSEDSESGIPDISNHPIIKSLQAENKLLRDSITPLHTERQQLVQGQLAEQTANILQDLESVRDETDQNGTYLYPELHDDPEFIGRWKQLVSAFVRTIPGLSYADAARKACQQLRSTQNGNSQQAVQTKFLPKTNGNVNERARSAASSVRGRSAPPSSGFQVPDKIPRNNRDLVRLAHEMATQDN